MSQPSLVDLEWPVPTERLLLRPATVADVEQTWDKWRRRDAVGLWMTTPTPDRAHYLERLTSPERLPTILVAEHEGRVVLDMHVRVQDSYAQADVADRARATKANLGWSMDPEVQGRGLATEALRATIGICFDQLGLHRVEAGCFAANVASWRLMERVGMRRESHAIQEGLHRELGWSDMFGYGMLATEWVARRGG